MERVDYFNYTFKYLKEKDFHQLNLNEKAIPLYLIKWCDLDYEEVTWEKESDLNCSEKINNFKQYSKIPSKKDREKMEENKKYHKIILNQMRKDKYSKENPETIEKCKRKLYHLQQGGKIRQFQD